MSAVIKYLHSGLTGAPVLSGTAGALRAVLDACLVDGWGTATADSVTITSGIATVTRSAGHPFEAQTVALISGAAVSGSGTINGEQTVLSTTATTYTFATLAVGTVSGTVQHKFAPLGFTRATPGTNTAAYQITGSGGTGFWLRLDDTGTTTARVVGYEAMSDVNTGTNAFPTAAQFSGGLIWGKSNSGSTGVRGWTILGDDRGFYMYTEGNFGSATGAMHGFGDFNSLKPADAFNCFLAAWDADYSSGGFTAPMASNDISCSYYTNTGGTYIARPYTGTGSPRTVARQAQAPMMTVTLVQSGAHGASLYPNAADGSLIAAPVWIIETASPVTIRGSFPGLLHIAQSCSGVFTNRYILTGITGLTGRSFRVLTPNGLPVLIDNTGPWRS